MRRTTIALVAMTASLIAASSLAQTALPTSIDWRSLGAVSSVKDQGQCESSWAFAAVASIEGAVKVKRGVLRPLSVQELIDCSGSHGNLGCNGGRAETALAYVHSHGGLAAEAAYPYTARDGSCKSNLTTIVSRIAGFHQVAADDGALLAAVASQPVAVEIHASDTAFRFMGAGAGVYPCIAGQPNHWVTIVGYGTDNISGKDYWLIKNSWGTSWGDQGYAKIERGAGCRDIAGAVYPVAQ
jgi:C1A family cysteine protease